MDCRGAWTGAGAVGALEVTVDIPERVVKKVKRSEVRAKVPARTEVSFLMKLEPVGVLIKESPPPPNTRSPAPRPVWRSTTRIIKKQAMTCTVSKNV